MADIELIVHQFFVWRDMYIIIDCIIYVYICKYIHKNSLSTNTNDAMPTWDKKQRKQIEVRATFFTLTLTRRAILARWQSRWSAESRSRSGQSEHTLSH